MGQASTSGRYITEIDTLRAVAVLLVAAQHWTSLLDQLPLARAGVRLFFVISGFLITSILLEARQRRLTGVSTLGSELKTFYARRTLRIFPIYYAVLFCLLIVNEADSHFVRHFHWHALYGTNLLIAREGNWIGQVTHFWSLAVEEQFYALWPLLILLVPSRFILPLLIAVVLTGPAFRLLMVLQDASPITTRVLTPSALDTLGAGALLALLRHKGADLRALAPAGLFIGLPITVATYLVGLQLPDHPLVLILQDFGSAIVFAMILNFLIDNSGSPRLWMFRLRPLLFLGTISYGFYVYHNFVPELFHLAGIGLSGWIRPAALLAATVAISAMSWWWFESPINGLKRHFPYSGAPTRRPLVA